MWGSRPSAPATSAPAIIASALRPINKNTLKASVDIAVPQWHLKFIGCLWHERGSVEWIAFPAREWLDKKTGERQFANLIEFSDEQTRKRFVAAALAAVHKLAGGGP